MRISCEELVIAARYLETAGMSNVQLVQIHHRSKIPPTFNRVYRYFVGKNLQQKNDSFGKRLEYIATQHKKGQQSIEMLVQEALSLWPL